MCGIVGLLNCKNTAPQDIEAMKNRMIHRGPDSEGTYISEDGMVALGHRRLAIVDITPTGAQPMISHNGRYVMVFNGEIYNHRDIKKKLVNDEKLGIKEDDFIGTSDSEVLLEAISAYGFRKAISLTKGMFAIAVYDKDEKCVYLTRDRIGEKPLYYGRVNETFAFASDIGSIAKITGFNNPINRDVLDIYFIHGYIPQPYSIYEGIHKLTPGCILKIRAPYDLSCEEEITSYWDIRDVAKKGQTNKFKGSFSEASDELERLLKDSIKDQMVADVKVGAFLSAGIDSSTTVALMQSLNSNKVKSFTIGMEDPKYNEATYAKEIANHLGTEHTELYITEDDAKKVIPKLPFMFGEPFADSSQIPTYLVSKMTKEHVTVSLSGDGGDELFCGYVSYNSVERIWNKMKNIPYFVRKPVSELVVHSPLAKKEIIRIKGALLGAKGPEHLYNISQEVNSGIGRISLSPNRAKCINEIIEPNFTGEVNHDIMLMDMMMYHPDDILVKVDRTAMAVSLETRVPMLDKDVVEFAWTLPVEYLKDEKEGKKVLRDVLYRYIPKEMMDRPKKGFSIPIMNWLREDKELKAWAESLIDRDLLKQQGLLNPDIVWQMWNDLIERGIWRVQIWYVLIFQQWMMEKDR
ncbi:MAG: asparagine synthase (glutamine-hydrolyzing) [Lachnospiraceae bacterium]|nr:asparagine synthase (glutamine-hydrolyzing) [Lachnospiraceae bacterium]